MLALALAAAAVVPRLLGGFSVLRQGDRLHLVMGFAGGALLGVALFETGPEAFEHGGPWVWPVVAAGAATFAVLERHVFRHVHTEDAVCSPHAGEIGAGAITTHAFIDGLAIGAAFQVSTRVGLLVSVAILLHAFADGMNTVAVLVRHGHRNRKALAWLAADATVPLIGAALGLMIDLPDGVFAGLLGFFAGMFAYLGVGSLLPHAHRFGRDRLIVYAASLGGIILAYAAATLG
jgi:ZIP family zinc transporter